MPIPNIHNFIVTNLLCAGVGGDSYLQMIGGFNGTCRLSILNGSRSNNNNNFELMYADNAINEHVFYYGINNYHELIDSLSIQGDYLALMQQALAFQQNYQNYLDPNIFNVAGNNNFLNKYASEEISDQFIKAILRSNLRRIEGMAYEARRNSFNNINQINNDQYQHNLGDSCLNDFADSINSIDKADAYKDLIINLINLWRHQLVTGAGSVVPGLGAGVRTPGGWFAPKYEFTDACNGYIPDPRALVRYPEVTHENMKETDVVIPSAARIREGIKEIHRNSWEKNLLNNNAVLTANQSRLELAMAATMCFANGANRIRNEPECRFHGSKINRIIFLCANIFAALHVILSQTQNLPDNIN